MKQKDLFREVASEVNLPIYKVKEVYDSLWKNIGSSLLAGESVKLGNLGTFKVKTTKSRVGRNPKTGEVIQIPEKKTLKFKVSKTFKNILN